MRTPPLLLLALLLAGCAGKAPLQVAEQGAFAVGGTVVRAPGDFDFRHPTARAGQTLHGDHAAVSYQIPAHARPIPLAFLHGAGQSSRCWDTTPDGREGWRTTFLRRGFPVYLVDQPRRGQAGRATVTERPSPEPDDRLWLENFRIHAGAFPAGDAAMEQFLRWMTPNTGPFDAALPADAFAALCRAPILVVFGDGIAAAPDKANWPADGWRARVEMARLFVDCVNRHGGDATLLLLPERGLRGNTHFPFADTNSEAVADQIAAWLRDKGLD